MAVRAKFRYTGYSATQFQRRKLDGNGKETTEVETVEIRSLTFNPVYHQNDTSHENYKFWHATPSGELKLGTVNPQAWSQFEMGREYYLDFTPAD